MDIKFNLDRNHQLLLGKDSMGSDSGFRDPFWDIEYPPISDIGDELIPLDALEEESYLLYNLWDEFENEE